MMKKPNCSIIAIEEHYWDPESDKTFTSTRSGAGQRDGRTALRLSEPRLGEMDEAGIDIQVLSHDMRCTQKLGDDIAADFDPSG